jgi:GNAT superfamily N-acetyltransferase
VNITVRHAGVDDLEHIRWALYTALDWDPQRELPPPDLTLQHPQAARYHQRWGRPGDLAVIASLDGACVGVAYCRLFTESDHGHGYVDEQTPELAVAVHEDHRGRGIGAQLMTELARIAQDAGFKRLSLSVDTHNPARRLYARLGYREIHSDEGGVRMILELE